MSMNTKTKKIARRKSRKNKETANAAPRPDFSGLKATNLRSKLSIEQIEELSIALTYIADNGMEKIPFPITARNYIGKHVNEKEIMMFFPGVKTKQEMPIHETATIRGKHFAVLAFPDCQSPIGETGLMYVCRQFAHEPTFGEVFQFLLDSVDGVWLVSD